VARLTRADRYKGLHLVIKSLPSIRKSIPDVRYTIVGEGDEKKYLLRLAQAMDVENAVELVRGVTDSGLSQLYQESDVFVMPSLKEGFGIVFLEAMAHGKPVIAGNHGGSPEIVADGVTGFLVNYGDTWELSQKITQLLEDHELRAKMGALGRERVVREFSFARFLKNMTDCLADVSEST